MYHLFGINFCVWYEEVVQLIPGHVDIQLSWHHFLKHYFSSSTSSDCVDHNKLWKILKEMGIPDHLICLLRNLHAGQEATVRTGHGTTDWFQIGKGVCQSCILSRCLFNLYAEYIMRNAGLEEAQVELRLLGEISVTSDIQITPPLW